MLSYLLDNRDSPFLRFGRTKSDILDILTYFSAIHTFEYANFGLSSSTIYCILYIKSKFHCINTPYENSNQFVSLFANTRIVPEFRHSRYGGLRVFPKYEFPNKGCIKAKDLDSFRNVHVCSLKSKVLRIHLDMGFVSEHIHLGGFYYTPGKCLKLLFSGTFVEHTAPFLRWDMPSTFCVSREILHFCHIMDILGLWSFWELYRYKGNKMYWLRSLCTLLACTKSCGKWNICNPWEFQNWCPLLDLLSFGDLCHSESKLPIVQSIFASDSKWSHFLLFLDFISQ